MRYIFETLRDQHHAERELVFRPIYAGHAIGLDHGMFTRRTASAAVLLLLFGAGCARDGGTNVTTAREPAAVVPAAPVVESTTTTAVAPPSETAPEPAADAPVLTAPTLATLEVDYQPQEGATATATIDGPNGLHSKSLDSGAALFRGLPAGTYTVTITVDSPSGDPSIGDSRVIINGGEIEVGPGDHGVRSCDDSGCH